MIVIDEQFSDAPTRGSRTIHIGYLAETKMASETTPTERSALLRSEPALARQISKKRGSISQRTAARVIRLLVLALGLLVTALAIAIVLQSVADTRHSSGEYKERRKRLGRNYDAFLVKGARGAVATENGRCSELGVSGK